MKNECDKNGLLLAGKKADISSVGWRASAIRKLRRLTALNLKTIGAAYRKATLGSLPATKASAAREWLCDNYYLIDSEAKSAVAGMNRKEKLPAAIDGFPVVYHLARSLISEAGKAGRDEAEAFLTGVQEHYTLSNEELCFFRDMLIAAIVEAIAAECSRIVTADGGSGESMSDWIGTLRNLSGADMTECVERLSVTESLLMRDPAGVYPDMSDATKEYYRACVARGARREGVSEAQFAENSLKKAEEASRGNAEKHVGYYIVPNESRTAPKVFTALYFAAPFLIASALAVITKNALVALILPIPLWGLWYAVQENVASIVVRRRFVCSLDPVKVSCSGTTVAVSCLITSVDQIKKLAKNLLRVRLSGGVERCGLIADLKESDSASRPEDTHLLSVIEKEIRKLNDEFGGGFFSVVRRRVFSDTEGKYIGRERKRGAITEFIRYINTGVNNFLSMTGDFKGVVGCDYLLALDADTSLSINAAAELTAVLEHPLNKAVVVDNRVVYGFGIAVPRLTTDIESSSRSTFSRIFAGAGGLHNYGGAGADLYRDVFGDGLFTGKGLIDVKVFSAAADGAFPKNRVLSHDVVEGGVMRTCTVSETELSDGFPTTVKSWLIRQSRWIRGDYQNALFLLRRRKNDAGERVRNEFALSDRFKLFDNIRRAFTPIFSMASIIVCALTHFPYRLPVLFLSFASVSAGDVIATVRGVFKPRIAFRRYITKGVTAFLGGCGRILINVMMLPQLAASSFTELAKSVWRSLFSHKRLLEWVTSAEAESAKRNGIIDYYLFFRFTAVAGVASMLAGSLVLAVSGALWLIAPAVFCDLSRPARKKDVVIDQEDEELLYSFAASMWRFFDRYVSSETNFLPPDNVQYSPYRVAMRTSPTNIGLYLLCVLAARDLGFIDSPELFERVSSTLNSLCKMKKWNGNLYNWYDVTTLQPLNPEYVSTVDSGNLLCCLTALKEGVKDYYWECAELRDVCRICESITAETDISALYNKRRRLFYIGYDAVNDTFSNNMYDILMSEARMTSYYAIAKKVADKRHWGTLGRLFAGTNGYAGPLSWTGTMFEYYMPHLLLPVISDSLTDEALHYALYCQKKRTSALKLPWGVSESGFFSFDLGQNYQYKAFGVQKLGLKRGLDKELVISPYSTFLTLPFAPAESISNLKRLISMGMNGEFGLYEAIDFTRARTGGGSAVIKSYMAHHTGMSLVSVVNCLLGGIMQKRFMRDADMRTAQKLLEEAVYDGVSLYKAADADTRIKVKRRPDEGLVYKKSDYFRPHVLPLSNGEFTTVVTDGGSGFSTWNGIDVNSRKRDLFSTPAGLYVLLKESGKPPFSITSDPLRDGGSRLTEFSSTSAVFSAVFDGMEAAMQVTVHGRIPAEIRIIKIGNTERRKKEAELLIYTEPVLSGWRDHSAHPAFSDLFIMCEYRADERCLLMWRRGDVDEDACVAYGFADANIGFDFETDRSVVLKKGEGVFSLPNAFDVGFSCATGTPVIPCAAIKAKVSLRGRGSATLVFVQCVGRNREEAISRLRIIRRQGLQNMMKSSWEAGMSVSGNWGSDETRLLGAVIPCVLFDTPKSPATAKAARANTLGRKALWTMGISGDNPIVSCVLSGAGDISRAVKHINAHSVAGIKGIIYDLCIIYREGGAYEGEIRSLLEESALSERKGVFLIDEEKAGAERVGLLKAASVYCEVCGETDSCDAPPGTPFRAASGKEAEYSGEAESFVPGGAFESDAFAAYPQKSSSPLPWCFPLVNASFGTLVSDSSLGFSYFMNSRLNQMTSWSNDYMTDNTGERLIIESGGGYRDIIRGSVARFGRGFAEFFSTNGVIESRTEVCVHKKLPVKIIKVTLYNRSEKPVKARLAYYAEPFCEGAQSLVKVYESGDLLFAENPYNDDWLGMTACVSCSSENVRFQTGKESFWSGNWDKTGGMCERPCAAVISSVDLKAGESTEVFFYFSAGKSRRAAAYPHILFSERPAETEKRSECGKTAITIKTPSEDLDRLINFYLPYQTKASRVYGRTGFSQNSGAYGFRDQLQDVCALLYSDPKLAERHIYKAASAQFEEGDVLHWWHKLPKDTGGFKGVRTRCSDDLFWLPYAVAVYVETTGNIEILSKNVNFITGDNLRYAESERYISPKVGGVGTIYEHCKRALEHGYKIGRHGLLLFGSGDWNDGMNKVGVKGAGESVWLTMFACAVMDKFANVAEAAGDKAFADILRERNAFLKSALENCWERDRYIRGYHDSGEKLGSADCSECRIDSLPQSFSVFACLDKDRSIKAVMTAMRMLISKDDKIVRLFDPPFCNTSIDVGYIKRYPAGIRENGGQYTHAAVWLAIAAFRLGMCDDGAEILEMISPITHSFEPAYKTEPYFLAADIYTAHMQSGRGGWTMYTGAAAWYYRAVIEEMLGLKKRGRRLYIDPRVPSGWQGFEVACELDGTELKITARRTGKKRVFSNGTEVDYVALDGGEKTVIAEY
ncbi:MAG: DUF3131 domain-containing protein [Clostridia bacterium]|nr:DUF3131 domain-containing protein [Clostridia bacterium]